MPNERLRASRRLVAAAAVLSTVVGCRRSGTEEVSGHAPAVAADSHAWAYEGLEQLGRAAGCGTTPPPSPFCQVSAGWADGRPGDLTAVRALIGLRVEAGPDVEAALRHRVRLVGVALDAARTPPRASMNELVPESEQERDELTGALAEVQQALREARPARLSQHLQTFLTAPGSAKHALGRGSRSYRFDAIGSVELTKLERPHAWAALETFAEGRSGLLVSVLAESEEAEATE